MKVPHASLLVCLLVVAFTQPAVAAKKKGPRRLLDENFERSPLKSGWTQEAPGEEEEFQGSWSHRESASGIYSIEVSKGHWQGPPLPVNPGDYYRLKFQSKSAAAGFWAAFFFDEYDSQLGVDVYDSVQASSDWGPQEYCFRAPPGAITARMVFQPIAGRMYVDDVQVETADRQSVVQWTDTVAVGNPLLRYEPAEDRWKYLPNTVARLRAGGKLRIVMLGDSIVNDTSNSAFDVLLERKYPQARIELIPSVRGGTGCTWYKDQNRVRDYVLRYKPDLLMIGGISHGYDPGAIRSVIKQVRAKSSAEILVMNGPITSEEFSKSVYLKTSGLPPGEALENIEKFNRRLARMCRDQKVEFLDLRAAWNQYIWQSPRPQDWFMRDIVHSNSRGKQVVGRMLVRYFEPRDED